MRGHRAHIRRTDKVGSQSAGGSQTRFDAVQAGEFALAGFDLPFEIAYALDGRDCVISTFTSGVCEYERHQHLDRAGRGEAFMITPQDAHRIRCQSVHGDAITLPLSLLNEVAEQVCDQ